MIPLRIRLRNFLSYATAADGGPIEFDFEGATLWSIAGPNGVGKSALFDAITWTLFGEHRGGASEDHRLVRQGSQQGEAAFEFRLAGASYRVQRSVSAKTKSTTRQASVLDAATGTWHPIPDADSARGFDAWIRDRLGLRYKTFIASTMLLQGKSDRLVLALPKDRFEVLSGALDLRAYEMLARRAQEVATRRASELKVVEAQFGAATPVTPEDLAAADVATTAATSAMTHADAHVEEATLALADATRAEGLASDLALADARAVTIATLLARADAVVADYADWLELSDALPVVRRAVADLAQAAQHERAVADIEREARDIGVDAVEERARASAQAAIDASTAVTRARDGLAQSALALAAAAAGVAEVERCEQLEQLSARAQSDLDEIAVSQQRSATVEAELAAAELLRDAAPLVQAVADADRAHAERIARCAELGSAATIAEDLAASRRALRAAEAARTAAVAARDQAQLAAASSAAATVQAMAVLEARTAAAADGRCSRCGQTVGAAHIKNELTEARAEVASTSRAGKTAAAAAAKSAKTLGTTERDVAAAVATLTSIEQRAVIASAAEEERARAAAELARAHARLVEAATVAPVARDLLALTAAQRGQRLSVLATLPSLIEDAARVRADAGRAVGIRAQMATLERELAPLRATLDDAERRTRRQRRADATAVHARRADAIAPLEGTAAGALRQREACERERVTGVAQCDALRTRARAQQDEATALRGRAEGALATLPASLRERMPAERLLVDSERRFAELISAQERHRALERARDEQDELVARRAGLQRELDAIRVDRRQAAATWRKRRATAVGVRDAAADAREVATRHAVALRSRREEYERLHAVATAARTAARLAARLADLLGRTRLLARLMKDALRDLERLANEMLTHTSSGQLEVRLSLQAASGDEHILIEAIDHDSADRPMEVAFLSGGQKFRVAVALAAAIGQYMGAARAGRSLVVDEGFGSLDESGRHEMINELRLLAPLMDRVIVVSHHLDFTSRELFPSGYLIGKNGTATTVHRII